MTRSYMDRISVDSEIHFGTPCVRGTRVPVEAVLELVEAGISFDRITTEYYPDLSPEDVRACVQYALAVVRSEEVHVEAG